jgi:hypothetical protein
LSKPLNNTWEFHIRIFKSGFIESHIEINRNYLEHLGDSRVFTAYEAYEFYRPVYNKFYLYYSPAKEWIKKVMSTMRISLPEPTSKTPWKPIIAGFGTLSIIGLISYYLLKPPKGE